MTFVLLSKKAELLSQQLVNATLSSGMQMAAFQERRVFTETTAQPHMLVLLGITPVKLSLEVSTPKSTFGTVLEGKHNPRLKLIKADLSAQ